MWRLYMVGSIVIITDLGGVHRVLTSVAGKYMKEGWKLILYMYCANIYTHIYYIYTYIHNYIHTHIYIILLYTYIHIYIYILALEDVLTM